MINLDFPWKFSNGKIIIYTIIQQAKDSPYFFYAHDNLIGSVNKVNGDWVQISGRQALDSVIEGIGMFIEEHINLATLPNDIIQGWPNEVLEVDTISDEEYLIIIADNVDIIKFEIEFRDQIPELVNQEWQVKFQVAKKISDESFEVDVN
ncbi:hypothetical protein DHW03_19020 [Pedobacter yonginense]|uniref:Uncharacterized protein n=1 Tax=Pedobacter yonginense TaxID=651869 RepID=A0A317EKX4_9SPHI|nr:hypothetical protein [Pedobacter yonginense]PWS25926.1 hypothetical protein DHW03_19020 [Pedobacter yonginense]